MTAISDELETEFSNAPTYLADLTQVVDLTDLSKKFSMETIASCAFGVKAGSFDAKDSSTPFIEKTYEIFSNTSMDNLRMLGYMTPGVKHLMEMFSVPVNKPAPTQFLADTLRETIRHRQKGDHRS